MVPQDFLSPSGRGWPEGPGEGAHPVAVGGACPLLDFQSDPAGAGIAEILPPPQAGEVARWGWGVWGVERKWQRR